MFERVEAIKKVYGADKEPIVLESGEEIHPWHILDVETLEEAMSLLEISSDAELEMLYDRSDSAIN